MRKKKGTLVIGLLLVVAAGLAGVYALRDRTPEPQITTARVTRGAIVDSVGATGSLEAVTTVQVGTQVSGTIQQLNADFNSLVRKGQVLARLDPSLFQTQIEQARANLLRAQADVERLRVSVEDAGVKLGRARDLNARQLISRADFEAAEVTLRAAQAQLQSAQAQVTQAQASLNQNEVNLQHTVILSPIDGIVISRNVDVGQTVAASMQAPTLFVLAADLTKMKVSASIDEADVGRMRPGQHVQFRVDAYPAEEFAGTVSQVRLQPVVVQNVVTYATVIDVPNPDLKLKPGMTANVTIEVARRDDVVRIPNTALRFRPTAEIFAALHQTPPDEFPGRPGMGPGPAGGGEIGPQSLLDGLRRFADPAVEAAQEREGQSQPRGRGGVADPERRRQMLERLQRMSPEEREEMERRMRERGIDPETFGRGSMPRGDAEPAPAPRGNREAPRAAQPVPPQEKANATTIDSLFGPLPPTVSVGRVWLFVGRQLKPVRLRLGISDGSNTELLGQELQPGTELVTAVTLDQARPPATGASGAGRSPLMPGGRGSGGFGGPPRR